MAILTFPTLIHEAGFEGKAVNNTHNHTLIVGSQEGAVFTGTQTFLPFGRFLVNDGAFNRYRLPQTGDSVFSGISLATQYYEESRIVDSFGRSVHGYPATGENGETCPISVAKKGEFWFLAEDDITAGSFFIRVNENAVPLEFEGLGRIRSDADGANAVASPSHAVLLKDVVAGELGKVSVEFPVYGSYA